MLSGFVLASVLGLVPHIEWASQPVAPNQTVLLAGRFPSDAIVSVSVVPGLRSLKEKSDVSSSTGSSMHINVAARAAACATALACATLLSPRSRRVWCGRV